MSMQAELLFSMSGHRRFPAMPVSLARNAAWGSLVLLGGVAILLAWRRFAGGMQRPLDFSPAAATSLFVALCAAIAFGGVRVSLRRGILIASLSFVTAGSLTLPGASWSAVAVLWLPALACTVFTIAGSRNAEAKIRRPVQHAADPVLFRLDDGTSALTRRFVDATGRDCLEAVLQARFAAGSRAAVLHLAFSPPFLETPEVCWSLKKSCGDDVALGESAQVRATMVLPYGIRLELKLPAAPSTERTLPVQLSVVERASAGKL